MLRNDPIFLYIFLLLMVTGCIEPYVPHITGDSGNVYVINGEVTNVSGYQTITISTASSVNNPEYIPMNGCVGAIEDDKGHTFDLEESEPGRYQVWMDQEFLTPWTSYRLRVSLPGGDEIASAYDMMPACPALDTIYYERKEKVTVNTGQVQTGLQFYVDFHGTDADSRFYRWTTDETWEYHSGYPRQYYYDGEFHKIWPPDYTYHVCWITAPVKDIFTLATSNLVSNSYEKMPVQFVANTTNRLYVGYSALITQHAISGPAYTFWEQLRINSEEQGGLYEKQPLSVQGNLHNVTHPGNRVIGFFGASSVAQKRIFVDGIRDMGVTDGYQCDPHRLGNMGWLEFTPEDYPVYYTYWGLEVRILDHICVDCRDLGGGLTKPEFWPW
jgi:hypothetical protein